MKFHILYSIISLLFAPVSTYAQHSIAQFSFSRCSACAHSSVDVQPRNAHVSDFVQNNLNQTRKSNKFSATNWSQNGVDLSKYYAFKIKPNQNYQLDLFRIQIDEERNTNGIRNWVLRSNLDNFTSNIAFVSISKKVTKRKKQLIHLSPNFRNINQEVEFRFYAYGASHANGSWVIDNVKIYGKIPDRVPPQLTDIKAKNRQQIKCIFSEDISQFYALNPNAYQFTPNLKVKNVRFQYQDHKSVVVELDDTLRQGSQYQCTVRNLSDMAGNMLTSQSRLFTFMNHAPPEITNIVVNSNHAVDVFFDKVLAKAPAEQRTNYKIFDDRQQFFTSPISAILSPENPRKISLFFSKNLSVNRTYQLNVTELEDVHGNKMILNHKYFKIDTKKPKIKYLNVRSSKKIELNFSEDMDSISVQLYTNYLLDQVTNQIREIRIISPQKVLLIFKQEFVENQKYRIKIANLMDLQGNVMSTKYMSFRYDTQPPRVIKTRVLSATQIQLVFDERLDKNSAENRYYYTLSNPNIHPLRAKLDLFHGNVVTLTFPQLTNTGQLELAIVYMQDLAGNELKMVNKQHFNFDYPDLYAVDVISKDTLVLHFSSPLNQAFAENISNYIISNRIHQPKKAMIHPNDFRTVTLELSNHLELTQTYQISVLNVLSAQGVQKNNVNLYFTYKNYITSVYPISDNILNVTFKYPPTKADAEDKSMYQIRDFSSIALSFQDLSDPNIVHLQFISSFVSNKDYTLEISNIKLLSGNVTPHQKHVFKYDSRPPSVQSLTVIGKDRLLLEFSEDVSKNIENLSRFFYADHGLGSPQKIERDQKKMNLVILQFIKKIQFKTQYVLSVNYVEDLQKNRMRTAQQISFTLPDQPMKYDLIFNEIFPDPDPSVGLPNYEYLELYNKSNKTYNLAGLRLSDGKVTKILSHTELKSGEFIVLCPQKAVHEFQKYGNVLGLDSWLSLTNSGKILTLKNWNEQVVDSVKYADSWYHHPEKKKGGWSLEKIDYQLNCTFKEQWLASENILGGTPCQTNSVYQKYADTTAIKIHQVRIVKNNMIELEFSESVISSSLANFQHYVFEPRLEIKDLTILDTKNIRLTLPSPLDSSLIYTIYLDQLKDCAGNYSQERQSFAIGQHAMKHDVIISEIMPKEIAVDSLQPAEYIEIYNRSDKLISLNSIILEDATDQVYLPEYFLKPKEYLVLTLPKYTHHFSNVLGVPKFPSLNNVGERLILRDTSQYPIFSVIYTDSLFDVLNQYQGGYSIEMIDVDHPDKQNNWAVSGHPFGGTPAAENQPILTQKVINDPDSVVQNDFAEIEQVRIINSTKIHVVFKQKINPNIENAISVKISNYATHVSYVNSKILQIEMIKPLGFATVYKLELGYAQNNSALNKKWYYFDIAILKKEPQNSLLITEIMADESPSVGLPEAEYIEIYNASDSIIDLQKMLVRDKNSVCLLSKYYLLPKSYLLICSHKNKHKFRGLNVMGVSNFPSLSNSGETLNLEFIPNQEVVFSVTYHQDWYKNNSKKYGGWSLEMIDTDAQCQGASNWTASGNVLGGTPARPNTPMIDTTTISYAIIATLTVQNDSVLDLSFNADLDTSMIKPRYFKVSDRIEILRLDFPAQNIIRIINSGLSINNEYSIKLDSIHACNGIISKRQHIEFRIGRPVKKGDLKITEMMLDPSPAVGLPELEYFELYNSSKDILSLLSLKVTNLTDTAQFPTYHLMPKSYLLVCNDEYVKTFQNRFPNIQILGIEHLFYLKNTNASLQLFSDNDIISSINYDRSFYKHPEKNAGGWSLEMRDINYECVSFRNWQASQNPQGGTPGVANSVQTDIVDIRPPNLLKIEAITSDSVLIFFDHELDFSKKMFFDVSVWGADFVRPKAILPSQNTALLLIFADTFQVGRLYKISVQNIYGCNGKVQLKKQTLSFRIPEKSSPKDVLINEILFNPPINEVDFVELYNRSSKSFNLKNWNISNALDTNIITLESYILEPYQYVVLTSSKEKLIQKYIHVSDSQVIETKLPSFPDDKGVVEIFNAQGVSIDQLNYSARWHSHVLSDVEGISLERISLDMKTNDTQNWSSSVAPNHATPTFVNSHVMSMSKLVNKSVCITMNTDLISPNGDGYDDFLFVQFHCIKTPQIANIDIYDAVGRKVHQLAQNHLLSNQSVLRWDGLGINGNTVRAGYYIIYFELYDRIGNVQKIRKKVVVSNSLR